MRFIAATAVFAAATLAVPVAQTDDCPNPAHCGPPSDPSRYENINIKDFFLRKDDGGIQHVDFKLSGDNATDITCSIGATGLPSIVTTCGDDPFGNYSFALIKPTDGSNRDADLAIYHQTGVASGKWGEGQVPTYCHAGGNGPSDFVCNQIGQVTIGITSA